MLFLAAAEESGVMTSLLRTILMNLCNFIYKLIIYIYELFLAIGNASILNSEQIQVIYSRVGLILGIVMIFRLIFSFVQYMIDPDKITDKETGFGSIIKKFIVVILALALTDWVFNKAFELQEMILEENVIAKVVLGVESNDDVAMDEFGILFSYNLFSYFFYQNPEVNEDGESTASSIGCGSDYFETSLPNYIGTFKDFEVVHKCLNEDGEPDGKLFGNKVYYATFDGFEALLVGGAVLWMLIMYTITLGVRVVKLAFLRLIAPIPILSYLSPKKDTPFQKWIKQCVVTYLDLFIRLAIIYFCMLLISIIFQNGAAINASTHLSANDGLYKWFNIILILGILLFAKKLPEILGEIFPSMGGKGGLDLGLGLKSRTDFMGKGLATRAAGAAIGMGAIGAVGLGQYAYRRSKVPKENRKNPVLGGLGAFANGAMRGAYHGAHGGKISANVGKAFAAQARESEELFELEKAGINNPVMRYAHVMLKKFGLPGAIEELKQQADEHKRQAEGAEERVGFVDKAISGYDNGVDGIKNKIATNTTKDTQIGQMKHYIDNLERKGFVTRSIVNGEERVMSKFGHDVTDFKVGQLDDYFKQQHANATKQVEIAHQTKANKGDELLILNKDLERLNLDINTVDTQIANAAQEDQIELKKQKKDLETQRTNIQYQIQNTNAIIQRQDDIIATQSALLTELSIADIEKKFSEALQEEIVRGVYKDPNARTAISSSINGTSQLLSHMKIEVNNMPDSVEGVNNVVKAQVNDTCTIVEELNKKMAQMMLPENADMSFAELFGEQADWFTKNQDGSITIERIDFDAPKGADGKYPKVTETIYDLFDVEDKIKTILTSYKNYETEYARHHRTEEANVVKSEEYLRFSQFNRSNK